MKNYSTIHPLFMSFYSRALYQDVARNWRKVSFLYLLLLLAVCLIPETYQMRSQVLERLNREAPKIIKQAPPITLSKGKIKVEAQMPYVIKDPETGNPLIIIDTTGKVASLAGSEALALLTDSKLLVKISPSETKALELPEVEDVVIDQSKLYEWTELFAENFAFMLYPFVLLFSFLLRLVQALIFAVIGMAFAKNLRLSLSFQAMVSLAIVAMTPSLVFSVVYRSLGLKIPLGWLIGFVISMGYLFFAVRAQSERQTAP